MFLVGQCIEWRAKLLVNWHRSGFVRAFVWVEIERVAFGHSCDRVAVQVAASTRSAGKSHYRNADVRSASVEDLLVSNK